jgi:hypothetical protein
MKGLLVEKKKISREEKILKNNKIFNKIKDE